MTGQRIGRAPPVGLVTWRAIPGKRRGVVAVRDCAAGTELERSLVIFVPDRDLVERDQPPTVFDEYLMYWSDEPDREVVMGTGLLMIYNHSSSPNVELEDGPDADTMSVIALRDIKAGEELTYDYDTKLWFEPHPER
jgi:SET domain-containing protein